jgi:DNA-binding CsgD family transcriptional regulator
VPFFVNGAIRATLTLNFGRGVDPELCQTLKPALNRLAAALDRAMAARADLLAVTSGRPMLINSLLSPAFVLGADGRLTCANGEGERLLREGEVARLKDGALSMVAPEAQSAFERQLAHLRARSGPATPVVLRRASGSPLILRLLPYAGSSPEATEAATREGGVLEAFRVLAVMIDPDVAPKPTADLLRGIYGLTPAEAAVALAIADDRTLEEHAQAVGISVLTARNQLRAASDKMGARRQSEVVSRVLRLGIAARGV